MTLRSIPDLNDMLYIQLKPSMSSAAESISPIDLVVSLSEKWMFFFFFFLIV